MCPVCLATAVLIVGGVASTSGLAAVAMKKSGVKNAAEVRSQNASKEAYRRRPTQHPHQLPEAPPPPELPPPPEKPPPDEKLPPPPAETTAKPPSVARPFVFSSTVAF